MSNRVQSTADELHVHGVKTFEKRCDGCAHWTPPEPSTKRFEPEGFGVCCLAGGLASCYGPVRAGQTLAFATDVSPGDPYESCPAELRTKPEFSCVQWQAKDGADA